MKKLFLSIMVAGMLTACNQTNKTQTATASAPVTNNAEGGVDKAVTTKPPAVDTANAPVIKFEKDSYDFGKIKQGDKVSYDFKFTNSGKSPLIISNAVASCGCTLPEWPKAPVKPGDKGVVKVVFNSAGKAGLQDKLITITANTNPAQSLVHLVGEVEDPNAKK